MQKSKFRTVIGLILLYVAVLLDWQWVWGILFLVWVVPDIFSGITYFIEPVERKTHPFLYWFIIASWLWMSIYMIASSFFPQLSSPNYIGTQATKELGVYKDKPIYHTKQSKVVPVKNQKTVVAGTKTATIQQDKPKKAVELNKAAAPKDTLSYKTYHQTATHSFVGISAKLNANSPDLEQHTSELWNYFYENDISQVIPNIVDERVYFIYSATDAEGNYTATIAFRTKNIDNLYEGLAGIQIPPTKFAVFEQQGGNSEKFIADTWTKIYASNLKFSEGFNLEVYELDNNYKVKNTEIRISIK